jgi:hypothetical protein
VAANNSWRKKQCGNKTVWGGVTGLHRHQRWVTSADIDNSKWCKPVILAFRSRFLSSEVRSLLWQTMHSDGRFGYRFRVALRPTTPGGADCPCCGPDRFHPATDPGDTMEHAYGTYPGLDELWVWEGAREATRWTTAISDLGRERRPLGNCVGPHILSGRLGVIRLNNTYRSAKLAKEELERLRAWWSRTRAVILVVNGSTTPGRPPRSRKV